MAARWERELRDLAIERGYFVMRGAGSLGIDLLLAKPETSKVKAWVQGAERVIYDPEMAGLARTLLIEVKSVSGECFYPRGGARNTAQFEEMRLLAVRGFRCYYAVRHKAGSREDRWRFHEVRANSVPEPMHREKGMTIGMVL